MRLVLRSLLGLLLVLGMLGSPLTSYAQSASVSSVIDWMRDQQQDDGGFPGFGPGDTADAVLALVAAGEYPLSFTVGENSPLDFLNAQAAGYATSVGAAAKLTMAAVALDADPTAFGGVNLLEVIGAGYDPATGQYGEDVYSHALALLAIRSVGVTPPTPSISWLVNAQLPDGGWSFDGTSETGSDTNTTALAIQALVDLPDTSASLQQAVAYLGTQQNSDGGFPYSQTSAFGNDSDANSTAAAIQALVALGEDPQAGAWVQTADPLTALEGFQNESGALRYQDAFADDNALATYQGVPGLLLTALPVAVSSVDGAEALLAPAAAEAPAALPATGGAELEMAGWLAFAALALLGGLYLRRKPLA